MKIVLGTWFAIFLASLLSSFLKRKNTKFRKEFLESSFSFCKMTIFILIP